MELFLVNFTNKKFYFINMSGNLFQKDKLKAKPIKSEIAPLLQQLVIKELLSQYPDLEYACIGSIGKKKDGEYNGDIDIAIKCDTIEELEKMIKSVFNYTETVTSKSLYIVSMKYPYKDILDDNKLKFAAVDFMMMKDKRYTEFRYWCPDYRKDESRYKVGVKIMWTSTILNHTKDRLEGVELDKGYNASLRFVPTGLYRTVFKSNNFHVVRDEFVTTDVDKIVNMVFDDGDASHFNSVETLWEGIHGPHYRYPEEVSQLEASLMINSYRKSWGDMVNPRDFMFQHWTYEEIDKMLIPYKNEKKLNTLLDKIQGIS